MSSSTPPSSYTTISPPFTQISISHHPSKSSNVTPIVIISIDRPQRNNAFTTIMENDLVRAFDLLDQDERVKVIVVTGKGKMFCAGADLPSTLERVQGEGAKDHRDGGGRVALAIHRCRKPTIAAIQGPAIGVGITMTLPMTIRIAYTNAKIGFVFSQRGFVMEAASSFFLPRLIGHSNAIYLATTGLVLLASDLHFGPLFHELLPKSEDVFPRALEVAEQVRKQTSTVSTYLMREMMYRGPSSAEATHLLDSELMWELYGKEDKREGIQAFLEKRDPVMKGDLNGGMPKMVPWWDGIDVRPRSVRVKDSKI